MYDYLEVMLQVAAYITVFIFVVIKVVTICITLFGLRVASD